MRAPRTKSICGHIQSQGGGEQGWFTGGGGATSVSGNVAAVASCFWKSVFVDLRASCLVAASQQSHVGLRPKRQQQGQQAYPARGWAGAEQFERVAAAAAAIPMSTNWQLKWSFVCCPFVNYKLLLQFTFVSGSQQSFRYHVDTLWGRFQEGKGESPKLLAIVFASMCVSVCVCAAMFYVQVFNIVFDEVISICCLMNCNGWLCHQITIALLEFHWYIEGGIEAGSGATFGNDNKHCYRHHWDRCLIALARISLVIDVNMQSLPEGQWNEEKEGNRPAQWHSGSCEAQVLGNLLCKWPRLHVLGQLESSFDFYCMLKVGLF